MKNKTKYFLSSIWLLVLVGCGEPNKEDYLSAFKEEINTEHLFVSEPELISEETSGNNIRTGAKFNLTVLDDFYIKESSLESKDLVKLVVKKNEVISASVDFIGEKINDSWRLVINDINYDKTLNGKPLSDFDEGSYVVKGSKLEKEIRKQVFDKESKAIRKILTGTFVSKYPIACNNQYIKANALIGGTFDYKLSIPDSGDIASSKVTGSKVDRFAVVDSKIRYLGNRIFEVRELNKVRVGRHEDWFTGDIWLGQLDKEGNSIHMQVKNHCATVVLERYVNKDTDPKYAEERKKLRDSLEAGVYKSISPITKNGQYVKSNDLIGGTVKYQLTIPKIGDVFTSKLTGSKRDRYAVVDSKFIFDDTDTFYLKEMEKKRLGGHENWYTGGTWKVSIIDSKTLKLSINDTWEVTLEK